MSYQPPPPPPPPYGPPPGYPVQQPPRKSNATKIALIVTGGVVALCLGMVVIGALLPDDTSSSSAPATAEPVATTAVPEPPKVADLPEPSASPKPVVKKVKMPDLKGENAKVAQEALKDLGFTKIELGTQDLFDSFVVLPENWTVQKQSTKAGKTVTTDKLIVLTCTKLDG